MSIQNPTQLVTEFKKSGEFDRLRRELLTQFQTSDNMDSFMARVESIARERLDADVDNKLEKAAPDALHRELLQELNRYPLVERALADVPAFSDPAFAGGVRAHARKILQRDRGEAVPEDNVLLGATPNGADAGASPGAARPNGHGQALVLREVSPDDDGSMDMSQD
ncbi:hypothetical protein FA95DRAFT_1542215 [Auriscalpium vulgare]|uniref:Uncharacterized protein n=1 Tax=Auriscalpium vulgare TaxID=40419 RepID=A0ACB8RRJ4_9AGAM|nr:hypothetical protein FA95DRAFT_1542215 [Auriscalpium vulgare]